MRFDPLCFAYWFFYFASILMCFGLVFRSPKTPIELAIDFILHDFEMAGEFLRNTHDNNVAD